MSERRLYKVIFFSQGQVYEVFAKQVSQGGLHGFIEVEGLVFGETTQVVVDPGEERLKKEFEGVERFYLPMHTVLRIDEVEKRGTASVRDTPSDKGNVASFPMPVYGPPSGKD